MNTPRWLQAILIALPAAVLLALTLRHYPLQSLVLVASSLTLFYLAGWGALRLFGPRPAALFAVLAVGMGWFAEQMGSSKGWFFGHYTYTEVLGPRWGDVPVVIPLMWFALCWIGLVLAKLLLWRDPLAVIQDTPRRLVTALLAAMLVTAFDLGADPYFVFVLKAWIMAKTDGGWFGETLQGFVGWMLVSFLIVLLAQRFMPGTADARPRRALKWAVLLAPGLYASAMVFQMIWGHPIETRAVALFAMGIPLLVAFNAWWQWQKEAA